MSQPPRRLHQFSIVRGIQPRQLAGALPALFVLLTNRDLPLVLLVVGILALVVVTTVVRIVAWQRHTYEFSGGRIVERSGIISRSERALEIDRIQQVDVDRTMLDRLVGTCELRMETAADSGEAELTLRVVSLEEADRLRALLARRIDTARTASDPTDGPADTQPVAAPAEEVLVEVPLHHVALAAVTGPRLLAGPAAAALLFGFVAENASDRVLDTAESAVTGIGVGTGLAVFGALVLGSLVLAAATGLVRDGGFRMVRRGDDLLVTRGLTTTRSATVPMRRVQRVTVRRRWLQQALGFASVTVHSAGGGGGDRSSPGGNLDRSLTVPLLPLDAVDALVRHLLAVETTPDLHQHPRAARRRSVVRGLLGTPVLLAPVVVLTVWTGRPVLLVLCLPAVAFGALSGLLAYGKLASGADDALVAGRTGLFGTTTELSPLRKTQGTSVTSSVFQRRLDLASLHVHVAGPAGGITLLDLAEPTAQRLAPSLLD